MTKAAHNTVCILTPPGRGAIAVVQVRGPESAAALRDCLRTADGYPVSWLTPAEDAATSSANDAANPPSAWSPGQERAPRHRFARWQHADGSEDVVVIPRGIGEFEICTHGGVWASELVCEQLGDRGFQRILWKDSFAIADPNRWRVAAELAVLDGKTLRATDWLLQNAHALPRFVSGIEARLQRGETAGVLADLTAWLPRRVWGTRIRQGWNVVIAGRPNVGKSTLFNRLLGFDRAIVYDQPGSTRDVVSELTAIAGWPVWFSDTAGLRETADLIEQQGVVRAERALEQADLVILVSDRTQPWHPDEQALVATMPNVVLLHNKADLPGAEPRPPGLVVSLQDAGSVPNILATIADRLFAGLQPFAPFPTDAWQVDMIEEVAAALHHGKGLAALSLLRKSLGI